MAIAALQLQLASKSSSSSGINNGRSYQQLSCQSYASCYDHSSSRVDTLDWYAHSWLCSSSNVRCKQARAKVSLILAAFCAWQWLLLATIQPTITGKAMATVTAKRLPVPCRQLTLSDTRRNPLPQRGWQSVLAYLYPLPRTVVAGKTAASRPSLTAG